MISIIVPVYKVESYLDRCIQSILRQTYSDFELILVDDGSPDNCPAICDSWSSRDSRIKVIHKTNGGLSDARNAGMKVASGDYVGFIDSDDWVAPEFYQRLLDAMVRDRSDIAACTVKMVWDDNRPSKLLTVQKNLMLDRLEAQKTLLLEKNLKQPVWYKLYKRKLVQDIPFEIGKAHEDVYWSYQAIAVADRVSVIDYIGYFYFQRSDSIMGNVYSLKRLDVLEAYRRRYEYLQERYPSIAEAARINYRGNCIYQGQMCEKFLKGQERKEAVIYLRKYLKMVPIKPGDCRNMKISHKIWIYLSMVSFTATCRLKNRLGIGL